jgi:hypothetical protein
MPPEPAAPTLPDALRALAGILAAVYVPAIVIMSDDVLGHEPLGVLNFFIACLRFDVRYCPLADRV